jgi:hypothetical protein
MQLVDRQIFREIQAIREQSGGIEAETRKQVQLLRASRHERIREAVFTYSLYQFSWDFAMKHGLYAKDVTSFVLAMIVMVWALEHADLEEDDDGSDEVATTAPFITMQEIFSLPWVSEETHAAMTKAVIASVPHGVYVRVDEEKLWMRRRVGSSKGDKGGEADIFPGSFIRRPEEYLLVGSLVHYPRTDYLKAVAVISNPVWLIDAAPHLAEVIIQNYRYDPGQGVVFGDRVIEYSRER